MTDETPYQQAMPEPDAELRKLDRLVGSWRISGGAEGQVRYEW